MKKKYWWYFMVLIFAVILPLIWLPSNYSFLSEEDNFANFQYVIYRNIYSWAPSLNNGQPVTPGDNAAIIPIGIFYYLLSQIHIPNYIIQRAFLSLMIFITFISVAYFLTLFTRKKLIILVGVLFYYLNFYVGSTIFYSAKMSQLILMPLFFTFMYKYLETKKYQYAIYNFFSLFFLQSIFSNLPVLFVTISVYWLAIIYFILKTNFNILRFIRNYWYKIIFFIILTLPLFSYNALTTYFSFIFDNSFNRFRSFLLPNNLYSAINLVFQFRGSWWEFIISGGIPYNPWLWFYSHPIIVFISFILVIVIVSLFLEKPAGKTHIFWLFIFLGSIFLASGTFFYRRIYFAMYNHLPFFYIFREPWAKFTPILIFSTTVLLVLSLENKKKYQKYLIIICLVFIIIKGAPFFSNKFYNVSRRWYLPFIKLPDYWKQYEEWSKTNQDKKILSIPINYFKRQWYKENIGNVDHPLFKLFGYTPVLYYLRNNNFGFIIEHFINNNNPNFVKIASIDYALVQEDIDKDPFHYSDTIRSYNQMLKSKLVNRMDKQFGDKLFLYTIKPELQLPQIYTAKNIVRINTRQNNIQALDKLAKIVSSPDYQLRSAIVFNDDYQVLKQIPKVIDEVPLLEFQKINLTKYRVSIKQAPNTFLLVFNDSFNRYWKMYFTKIFNNKFYETWLPSINKNIFPLSDNKHFMVNGYANAWFIETNKICSQSNLCHKNPDGSYKIELIIEYWPQRLFYLVIFIIGISVVGCFFYPLYIYFKNRRIF